MHVEFTFFEWLTLYSWPLRGYGRIVNLPATCTVVDVPVKFKLCILKTERMHVEFTSFEWLTLYSQAPWGTVESSTPPRPAPESPWPVWEVWTSYLENCANASRQTDRQRQRQRQTDNPLYRYRRYVVAYDEILNRVHIFRTINCYYNLCAPRLKESDASLSSRGLNSP